MKNLHRIIKNCLVCISKIVTIYPQKKVTIYYTEKIIVQKKNINEKGKRNQEKPNPEREKGKRKKRKEKNKMETVGEKKHRRTPEAGISKWNCPCIAEN